MSTIIQNKLYLGDMFDANNEEYINENGINCIICVAENLKIITPNKSVKRYYYNFQDDYSCNISVYFDEIGEIIQKEGTVLVNCVAGISRSSTIVIAHLMKYHYVSLKEAFLYVRSKRKQTCPNKKFMECLLEYELKLYGKNSLTNKECIDLFYYK
jgi:protein-tyrosine phosphatase